MGYYINIDSKGNPLPAKKVKALVSDGAIMISKPKDFIENLVCVVDNGLFDAAGYCYSKDQFEVWAEPDTRRKTWLIYDKAKELAK